jgi:hypothetical protein
MVRKRIYNSEALMRDIENHINYILNNRDQFKKGNGFSEKNLEEMKDFKQLLYLSECHHLLMEKQHRKFSQSYRLYQATLRELIEEHKYDEFVDFVERNTPDLNKLENE